MYKMSSYVSASKYSLPPNFTYREKVDFVTRMCKSKLWPESECVKYIEELERAAVIEYDSLEVDESDLDALGRIQVRED